MPKQNRPVDRVDTEAPTDTTPTHRPLQMGHPDTGPAPDHPRATLGQAAVRDNNPVTEAPTSPIPVILGIDDLRRLPRATRIARTSREGVQLLEAHRGSFIDELWLDHDLGGDDTIMPVVTLLEEAAFNGQPFRIGAVFVHSANPIGAETIVRSLNRWNYHVQRATA
ncbi:cyclic-phosphate processing receiver domain-containing protein [Kitasatospora sp. NPDC093806]|uniref:cyclic-phosphate processing receiver domain-containing protein n=1 Tax=Kitasatospora sp. NPDC093806 TaxID=3155075 RepID=UPI00341F9798